MSVQSVEGGGYLRRGLSRPLVSRNRDIYVPFVKNTTLTTPERGFSRPIYIGGEISSEAKIDKVGKQTSCRDCPKRPDCRKLCPQISAIVRNVSRTRVSVEATSISSLPREQRDTLNHLLYSGHLGDHS